VFGGEGGEVRVLLLRVFEDILGQFLRVIFGAVNLVAGFFGALVCDEDVAGGDFVGGVVFEQFGSRLPQVLSLPA